MPVNDKLQKRAVVQEKVKVRKKPRFKEIHMERMMCMLSVLAEYDFEIRIQPKHVNLGTDLTTLEAEIDAGKFGPVEDYKPPGNPDARKKKAPTAVGAMKSS